MKWITDHLGFLWTTKGKIALGALLTVWGAVLQGTLAPADAVYSTLGILATWGGMHTAEHAARNIGPTPPDETK